MKTVAVQSRAIPSAKGKFIKADSIKEPMISISRSLCIEAEFMGEHLRLMRHFRKLSDHAAENPRLILAADLFLECQIVAFGF